MLTIQPIPAFNDNYIWALVDATSRQAIVVDPGQAQPVLNFLDDNALTLSAIWITHKHQDHIGGVRQLKKAVANVPVFAHSEHNTEPTHTVDEGIKVSAFGAMAEVWKIAGHTDNHVAYVLSLGEQCHVFCGDTLFSGGCGRVFTGDMQAMQTSLQRLASLPDDTLFYPAHEYTASNLKFGLHIESNNDAMQAQLATVNELTSNHQASLPTSLALEKQINIFLRTAETAVIDNLQQQHGLTATDSLSVFTALRQLKDNF